MRVRFPSPFRVLVMSIFLAGQAVLQNEPNFRIVCNCIHELLNVFEDSAQREHTIICGTILKYMQVVTPGKRKSVVSVCVCDWILV